MDASAIAHQSPRPLPTSRFSEWFSYSLFIVLTVFFLDFSDPFYASSHIRRLAQVYGSNIWTNRIFQTPCTVLSQQYYLDVGPLAVLGTDAPWSTDSRTTLAEQTGHWHAVNKVSSWSWIEAGSLTRDDCRRTTATTSVTRDNVQLDKMSKTKPRLSKNLTSCQTLNAEVRLVRAVCNERCSQCLLIIFFIYTWRLNDGRSTVALPLTKKCVELSHIQPKSLVT